MGKQSVRPDIRTRSEADILSACMKYLKTRGIFHLRNNIGAMKVGSRYVKFGTTGCADLVAFLAWDTPRRFEPVWIECKRVGGKQSPAQKEFADAVTDYGMRYIVVHSAEELDAIL